MLVCRASVLGIGASSARRGAYRKSHPLRFSPLRAAITRRYASKDFDYNAEYFVGTKLRLEVDEETGNRSLFATEDLPANEILLITPYYNHVVHASSLHHFCNACHDSLQILGLQETAIRSKFIKSHRYCSEACRDRAEPIDELMAPPLRLLLRTVPDFYVSYNDKIRVVLYTMARKWLEKHPKLAKPAALPDPVDEEEMVVRLGRPVVTKENTLAYSDFERLCQLDIRERNRLLSPKIRDAFHHVEDQLKLLLHDSPLMKQDISALDVLTRNAANSFAVDKYDHIDPARAAKLGLSEPSGEATFPLASYFNHNCYPNCNFAMDMDANIVISTTEPVSADIELTISYNANGIKSPTKEHQSERGMRQRCKKVCRETWTFECDCLVP